MKLFHAGVLAGLFAALCGCSAKDIRMANALDDVRESRLRRVRSVEELRAIPPALGRFQELAGQSDIPFGAHKVLEEAVETSYAPTDSETLESVAVAGAPMPLSGGDTITRNQEAAVDEGDIVKKSGDVIIILRRGVLHTVSIAGGGLALADSRRVAQDQTGETVFYDEILALGRHVLLLGYNYGQHAAELLAYDLDPAGKLTRRGRYWLRSEDYYSGGENYGVRIVGDRLVMSLPLSLDDGEPGWPSWSVPDGPQPSTWIPLVEPDDIFMPLAASYDPYINLVIACPIADLDRSDLDCRSVGLVGSGAAEFYVTARAAYLATTEMDERVLYGRELPEAEKSFTLIYRIPHDASEPIGASRVAGTSDSQFSFRETADALYAATEAWEGDSNVLLLQRVALRAFGTHLVDDSRKLAQLALPDSGPKRRFTDTALWLGFDSFGVDDPELFVQPLSGAPVQRVPIEHAVTRLEPGFGRMIVTGPNPGGTLHLTTVDEQTLRNEGTLGVPDRVEAEELSHAFNLGSVRGAALFGLPTRDRNAGSAVADIDFFAVGAKGPTPAGRIDMQDQQATAGSDWYGDARLFFVGDRVFALSSNVIKEATYGSGSVRELRRVELPATETQQ